MAKLHWEDFDISGVDFTVADRGNTWPRSFYKWTRRAKVHGGWLVWVCVRHIDPADKKNVGSLKSESATLTFVPDPKHEWQQHKFLLVLVFDFIAHFGLFSIFNTTYYYEHTEYTYALLF